jgi:hypothetical protein
VADAHLNLVVLLLNLNQKLCMLSLKVLRGPVLWNDRNESQLSLQNRPSIEEHWKQKPLGLSAVSHVCVEVGKDVVSHGGCLHAPLGLWRLWPCGLRLRGLRWFLHSNGDVSKLVVLPRFLAAANLLASDARHALLRLIFAGAVARLLANNYH